MDYHTSTRGTYDVGPVAGSPYATHSSLKRSRLAAASLDVYSWLVPAQDSCRRSYDPAAEDLSAAPRCTTVV